MANLNEIAIGSDHGGYEMKLEIIKHLKEKGYSVHDFGAFDNNAVDYPSIALLVGEAVASGKFSRGIVICGTGIGISIAANKIPGIRAALCTNSYMARMSREHNDANILALGGRVIGTELALDIVDTWLNTPYSYGERHVNRLNLISEIEKKYDVKNDVKGK